MPKGRVAINETYDMPSRGLLGESTPAKITLRAMTTIEEKMRLASTGITVMPNIIKACLVEPTNTDTHNWTVTDIQFAMYKLRTVTYGPEYKISLRCPRCGNKFDVTVNLDDLNVNELPDGFTSPFSIGPLPVSGDMLDCKFLTVRDYASIEKESKRILKKYPDYVGDPALILTIQHRIEKVNDEVLPGQRIQQYIENMHARDLSYFNSKYNDISDSYGIDIYDMVETCPKCQEDVTFDLPMNEEFFRPKY